jgi:hypothetical protein
MSNPKHTKASIRIGALCDGGYRITKATRTLSRVTVFRAPTIDVGTRFSSRPYTYSWHQETQGYRRKGGGTDWSYLLQSIPNTKEQS